MWWIRILLQPLGGIAAVLAPTHPHRQNDTVPHYTEDSIPRGGRLPKLHLTWKSGWANGYGAENLSRLRRNWDWQRRKKISYDEVSGRHGYRKRVRRPSGTNIAFDPHYLAPTFTSNRFSVASCWNHLLTVSYLSARSGRDPPMMNSGQFTNEILRLDLVPFIHSLPGSIEDYKMTQGTYQSSTRFFVPHKVSLAWSSQTTLITGTNITFGSHYIAPTFTSDSFSFAFCAWIASPMFPIHPNFQGELTGVLGTWWIKIPLAPDRRRWRRERRRGGRGRNITRSLHACIYRPRLERSSLEFFSSPRFSSSPHLVKIIYAIRNEEPFLIPTDRAKPFTIPSAPLQSPAEE